MASLSRWGVGGAHGQVGRPGRSEGLPVGPPTFPFGPWVPSWAHLSLAQVLAFVLLVSCSSGPSTSYCDTCRILIRWNIVSWIKPNHYTAKISLKSPGHILEHHLWNMLVNKSILAFIPHFGPF